MNINKEKTFNFILCVLAIAGLVYFIQSLHEFSARASAKGGTLATCEMIGNFKDAQKDLALYKEDPIQYRRFRRLDSNKNGIACEMFKK